MMVVESAEDGTKGLSQVSNLLFGELETQEKVQRMIPILDLSHLKCL